MRHLRSVLNTLLGRARVIRDDQIDISPRWGYLRAPHQQLNALIDANKADYRESLLSFLKFSDQMCCIPKTRTKENCTSPCWVNSYLPGLDSVALYSIIALQKPRLYVEVGSGNSTMFARQCIRDHALQTVVCSIDP